MSADAERMLEAFEVAGEALANVVGIPTDAAPGAPRRVPPGAELVDRDKVPDAVWAMARSAMDMICVGVGLLTAPADESFITVEEGLAELTRRKEADGGHDRQ